MMEGNEDVACDFLSFLVSRLGQERDATTELLGEWLASYEPLQPRDTGSPAQLQEQFR